MTIRDDYEHALRATGFHMDLTSAYLVGLAHAARAAGLSVELFSAGLFNQLRQQNPLLAAWIKHGEPYSMRRELQRELSGADIDAWMQGSMRSFRMRRHAVRRWAWGVPSAEALEAIAAQGRIVEIGAGSGYWAHLLRRDYHVDILCYDKAPPGRRRNGFGYTRTFTPVLHGTARKAKQHSDRALFLCWPPYVSRFDFVKDERAQFGARFVQRADISLDLATRALQLYRGSTVIYVGEDCGGCNAAESFFDLLDAGSWQEHAEVAIPQWDGLHDSLRIWRR